MIINNTKLKTAKKQSGAVLFTSLMFLIILTMLAVTSMSTNTLEEKMAANSQETNYAFQAAESALALAWDDFWDTPDGDYKNFAPVTIANFDGNSSSITYSSSFSQEGPATRCDNANQQQCNEAGKTAKQFYEVTSTSTTSTGLVNIVNAGGFRWGPASQ